MFTVLFQGLCFRAGRRAMGLLGAGALALALPVASLAQAAPLKVVASFSILGDMVHEIGGDHIALTTIVGPDGDAHSFEPAPRDAKALAQARLLFINGLDFEGWLPRLVKASGFKGVEIAASKGVVPRTLSAAELSLEVEPGRQAAAAAGHGHEASVQQGPANLDPHAWQSLDNGIIYAQNIAAALAQADPAHAADYNARATAYMEKMKALDIQIRKKFQSIPASRRRVVTSHDAFGYFGRAYGVRFIAAAGLSNEAEPSAKEVAAIIDQVKQGHIPAVFVENITNPKLVDRIAQETGAKVGGTLYSDALAQPGQPAGTYLGMFAWNADQLMAAFQPDGK